MNIQPQPLPPVHIQLDWESYFREFCIAHGGNPLILGRDGDRLVFPDGWSYSSTDYAGPEWPPPDDPLELSSLQRAYWQRRLVVVTGELRFLRGDLEALENMQRVRQVPLQQVTVGMDMKAVKGQLDLSGLRGRVQWLEADVEDCRSMLRELEGVRDVA